MMEDLLIKYVTGDITPQEKEMVVNWLSESKDHMDQYLSLHNLYSTMLWNEEEKTQVKSKVRLNRALQIAAVFTLILFSSYLLNILLERVNQPDEPEITMQKIHVPSGQRAELTLADGTHIWLNANTTFYFSDHFSKDQRLVQLDGEARFNVSEDSSKPFVIKTNQHEVKVLGTEFNVSAYSVDSVFETVLLNGKVEVLNYNTDQEVTLKPMTKVTTTNNRMHVSTKLNMDSYRWIEGLICLEDESVEDLIHKLQLYFNTTIIINNAKLKSRKYSGKFRTDDGIEHIIKVLQLNNDFTYKRNMETNEIIIN